MYPLGDMLIQLKNAQAVGHEKVLVPFSKINLAVLSVLKDNNFIEGFDKKKRKSKRGKELNYIDIKLKYDSNLARINEVKFISKPSRRYYAGKNDLKKIKDGYGISVVTTSRGVMSGSDAKKQGIGGEILFEIW